MYRFSCVEFKGDSSTAVPYAELISEDDKTAPCFDIFTLGIDDLSLEEISKFPPKDGTHTCTLDSSGEALDWVDVRITDLEVNPGKIRDIVARYLQCPLNDVEIEIC